MTDISKLQEFDFVIGGDFSGSTLENDCPGGMTRNAYMQETAFGFAHELAQIDQDGVGVVVGKGTDPVVKDHAQPQDVKALFGTKPGGSTPMDAWLKAAFDLAGRSDKKDFIAFFFDGVPDDKEAVKRVLREQANKQANDDDLTVLFVQIGNDAKAKEFLDELDNGLGAKFDIVDTCKMEELVNAGSVTEVILKAIAD